MAETHSLMQFVSEGGKVLHEGDDYIVYLTKHGRLGVATRYEATQLFPREWLARIRLGRHASDRLKWLEHAWRRRMETRRAH